MPPRPPDTRLDRLWRARFGTVAHARWTAREARRRFGFWWALSAIGAIGLVSPLYDLAAGVDVAQWLVHSWQLVEAGLWIVALMVVARAVWFDVGLTGRTALPRGHRWSALHPMAATVTDATPAIGRDARFTVLAAAILAVVYATVVAVLWLAGFDPRRFAVANADWMAIWAMVVVAPVGEEVLFRGIVYTAFRRDYGPGLGAVLSAVVFALAHPLVGGWQGPVHLNHLFGGFVFAFAFERTGSLWPGIILHFLGNASLVVLGLL